MAQPLPEHVPGRLLVHHSESIGIANTKVQQLLLAHGARLHHKIEGTNILVLEVPDEALDAIAASLRKTQAFTFVERDLVAHAAAVPNDTNFASQWQLPKIQAPAAWDLAKGSRSLPVAILDSGVDKTHPDLASKLVAGWNFLNGTTDISDVQGHGTAVAGVLAAATNNLTGIAGVTWANPIMPLVVLDANGNASYSNVASAINYAADHGARIINVSVGGIGASTTLQTAVDYAWRKGAVVIAAAGSHTSSTLVYPAACNHVIAVTATDSSDTITSYSNHGSFVGLSAPGEDLLTTSKGGGYSYWAGTSLATPVVSGVAALVLSVNPSLTPTGLVSILEKNSDDLGAAGFDTYYGWGRINAYKSVLAARGLGDTTAPTVAISAPLPGATVSGTVAVKGTASDNVGVTKVELYVDGALYTTGTAAAFSFSWNSAGKITGPHMVTVKAYDAAGNNRSAVVSVNVTNTAGTMLWSGGMETGSTSEWYYPSTGHFGDYGGGEYDSGIASTVASSAIAHTGSWSAKMSITTPSSPTSGTRMFRWMEARANRDLYYSVWVNIPTYYTLTGDPANGHYWNLFQFKSRTSDDSRIDPVWAFYIDDNVPGKYYLQAGWGWGGVTLAGPYAGDPVSGKYYTQRIAPLPIGQWVHLEAFLHQSNAYDGRLTFWQDGVRLFDFANIVTSYNNCNFNSWCTANEWAVNLYSDGLLPNPASIYIDDAEISTGFIP